MRILIIGMIVLALSVAGISTYLIQSFSTPEAIGELEKQSRRVTYHTLVANFELQPGDAITPDNVTWRAWPEESLSEFYITVEEDAERDARFQEIVGSMVRRIILAGEPILSAKIFKADTAGFLSGILDEGMRAISVDVTPNTGVSGFILPGDRIDILIIHEKGREAVQKMRTEQARVDNKNDINNAARNAANNVAGAGGNAGANPGVEEVAPLQVLNTTTETIMENVLVLAVDQTLGKVEGQTIPARTLTLQLTPKQVEIIMTARSIGMMTYSLRGISSTPADMIAELGGKAGITADDVAVRSNSFTNDVEVSSFISSLTTGMLAEQEKEADELHKKELEEAERLRQKNLKEAELLREKELNAIAVKEAEAALAVAEAEADIAKAIAEIAAARKKNDELTKLLEDQANQPVSVVEPIVEPVVAPVVAPVVQSAPQPEKKAVVEIFRAGASETEVIEFK